MRKTAIIGSNSFLARNLIKYLSGFENEYELFLYDKDEDCSQGNYQTINLGDVQSVSSINFDIDNILFFSGKTGGVQGFSDYESFIRVNEIYFLNFLKCYINQEKRPRIIYPGSRLIYRESMSPVAEDAARGPKSLYAVTKNASEDYLRIFDSVYGINYVILRICTPSGTMINDNGAYGTFEIFTNQAVNNRKITVFGDGTQRKTYTQMIDICEAFRRLINADQLNYKDYNLGGQALSLNDFAETVADKYNVAIEHIEWPEIYKAVDGGTVVLDSSRFDNEFGMKYHKIIE